MEKSLSINSFDKIKPRFVDLVNEQTFLKEASFALQAFNKNAYLNKATTASKLNAVMNVAQTGLSLNPVTKYAYLVPRYTGGNIECVLEPSYQGLVKLVTDTGSARNVYCFPVYEGDIFEETLGTTIEIKHVPKRESTKIKLFYAVAILHDGSKQVEVMTIEQINEIRDKSDSYKAFVNGKAKSAIWDTNYSEMGRKTVIKRIVKYLPKTDQYERLATAIELDNSDYQASETQISLIEQLLPTANLGDKESEMIYLELATMSAIRATELINRFKENQISPVDAGTNYGMKEVHEKLDSMGLPNAKKNI